MIKAIDEARLENDPVYRYEYLAEFIGFTADDVKVIHSLAGKLAPRVPALVERTYERLLSYDATARHFVPRQAGYEGPLPESAAALTTNHAQIRFRKEHLTRYLMQLVGRAYDGKMVSYLDMVGKMHTTLAGNPAIVVPLVQMNALMGLIADVLTATILELNLPPEQAARALRAFQKVLWIQNDFVNRHYCRPTV